jgi:integrase
MKLTDTAIRKAKCGPKPFKLTDGRGLYLLLHPNGSNYWRFKYRVGGKEKLLALGVYPVVSLATARERREEARKVVAHGADPGAVKRAAKRARVEAVLDSLKAVALEWFAKISPSWVEGHADKIIRRLERDVFPWIGDRPIASIASPELLTVLRRIESRGSIETAHRALQNCGQVLRYAVATGRAERDCSRDLIGARAPAKERHHPTITNSDAIGDLLRSIAGYEGDFVTRSALRIAPLVFVRPGELRHAEWAEIGLDSSTWTIPAAKMKLRRPHIVPHSQQAVTVLRELRPLTGQGRYVFPGARTAARPMSSNTVNAALRRLGYDKQTMTGHGFRRMASTILNEQGWNRDVIERQLAHADRDSVRAAYNYAEHLPERRKMMQAWADFLDGLAAGAHVVSLRRIG